jgi:glucose/arabinose dehydrogenase/lysophospholipase L1-like esterase
MSRRAVLRTVVILVAAAAAGLAVLVFVRRGQPPRLAVYPGERVVIVGNTLAERMQYFGHFEALLHSRFPGYELVVRDLGYSGDEVGRRIREEKFLEHGHELADHKPNVVIACFGFNESFAGPAGLGKFGDELEKFVTELTTPGENNTTPPRLALVSPIAHEDLHRPDLPDGRANNENLRLYAEAMRRVADQHGLVFVDLFAASQGLMAQVGEPLTVNGVHLSESGDRRIAAALDEGLFGPRPTADPAVDAEALRREVNEKNRLFFFDYRPANGSYVYGSHKTALSANFPAEFAKLRRMVEKRDRRIWALAQGKPVPERIDDSDTGALPQVASTFKGPLRITTPEEERKSFTTAPGFEVNLFASEVEFPDLKKPVAMAFDGRGRLWVTTLPSYPMYLPGEPVNDKILILEDTKGAGKADKMTVFADGLYLPTGLALGDGGAYVGCQPNVLFLKEGDGGTGRCVGREMILHGFGSADSHRAVNTFRWGPGGDLFFDEGVYCYSQVETPYGPVRNFNGAVYRYEPRAARLEAFISFKFGNPWGHAWDRWGQDFIADAADGENYYATAFACQTDYPRKLPKLTPFLKKEWRPTCGCTLVSSRQFPDDWQGDYLLNNTMNFQGVLRYKMREEGSGFAATPAEPLLRSSDPNFRPVDLLFGPDGALYVCDWFNPLIGHIEYSVRDPARDQTHGRIWRVTAKGRPLLPRANVVGASVPELLELLKSPEDATREQARLELRLCDTKQVTAELEAWVGRLDPKDGDYQHHLLEALWVCQHHGVVNERLLRRLLGSPEPRARAAATRVLCSWRGRVPDTLDLLRAGVNDENPRVRLEAVRALSYFNSRRAREIAAEAKGHPLDASLEYALKEMLATLDGRLVP